jgi:phenylacetate-coenzyme A ligase PaaK-like adenylate-forming protein
MSVRPEVEIVDPGTIERTSHKAKLIEVVSEGTDT